MSKVMKAIVVEAYGGPEVMKLKEIPVPTCGQGQVLVRVKSAGVNPVDVYIRDNRHKGNAKLPYTPGSDCAGIIEQTGPGVKNVKVGDRVFTSASVTGTYAEFALSESNSVFPIPGEKMTFAQAAGLGVPYFTAYRALFQKFRINENETVLIHGASGAVGIACIQLLRALIPSAKIVGTAGSEDGLKLAKNYGAISVYNHRDPDYVDAIIRDYPNGVDVIVEMLANENLEKDVSKLIGQNGRIAIVGCRDSVTINPRSMMRKESIVYGIHLRFATPAEIHTAADTICNPDVAKLIDPAVDKTFSLAEAAQSHIHVMESSGHRGKVVLIVCDKKE